MFSLSYNCFSVQYLNLNQNFKRLQTRRWSFAFICNDKSLTSIDLVGVSTVKFSISNNFSTSSSGTVPLSAKVDSSTLSYVRWIPFEGFSSDLELSLSRTSSNSPTCLNIIKLQLIYKWQITTYMGRKTKLTLISAFSSIQSYYIMINMILR